MLQREIKVWVAHRWVISENLHELRNFCPQAFATFLGLKVVGEFYSIWRIPRGRPEFNGFWGFQVFHHQRTFLAQKFRCCFPCDKFLPKGWQSEVSLMLVELHSTRRIFIFHFHNFHVMNRGRKKFIFHSKPASRMEVPCVPKCSSRSAICLKSKKWKILSNFECASLRIFFFPQWLADSHHVQTSRILPQQFRQTTNRREIFFSSFGVTKISQKFLQRNVSSLSIATSTETSLRTCNNDGESPWTGDKLSEMKSPKSAHVLHRPDPFFLPSTWPFPRSDCSIKD